MSIAVYCAGSAAAFIVFLLIRFNKAVFHENGAAGVTIGSASQVLRAAGL
jgi:hypothetical protein